MGNSENVPPVAMNMCKIDDAAHNHQTTVTQLTRDCS